MMEAFKMKGILILVVLVIGLIFAIPSFLGETELPKGWIGPTSKIKLGLDLKGGIHMVLKVESDKAVEGRLGIIAGDVKPQMIGARIRYSKVAYVQPDKLSIQVRSAEDYDALSKLMSDSYAYLTEVDKKSEEGMTTVMYQMKPQEAQKIKDQAEEQAIETIRNRINGLGLSETSVIPEGKDRIVVQIPGETNPERAKKIIGKTAALEFKLVDEEHSVDNAVKGDVPEGSYVAYMRDGRQPILLRQQAALTGSMIDDARVSIKSSYNEPYVSISFNSEGARIFERVTRENVGKKLAILLDGKVYSAPVIRDAIAGGKAMIEGRFSDEEARDLAIVLRAGALPAPVDIMEERTVGPSLGKDSIRMGVNASLVGGLLVVLFMVIYYKWSGSLADFALIGNIVIIVGVMALFGAVLTLPGIAGMGLTIGIAVDANILVFERIREELRLGRTPKMAIEAGYKNALSAILDANITTLIAALVLFQFGTGPVKGFAVTLSVGILATLFTALVLCKWIMEWMVNNRKIERISI
jgi:preprotein translocase subunit SecD